MKVKNKETGQELAQKPAAKSAAAVAINASANAQTNAPEFFNTLPLVAAPRGSNLRLLDIARAGDAEEAEYLLRLGADVNARNVWGWTPLMLAIDNGHAETCKLLIQNGADINARNNAGWTILIYAAVKPDGKEIYELLLHAGANPFLKNNYGKTASDLFHDNRMRNKGAHGKGGNGFNIFEQKLKMYESVWPYFGPKSMDFINSALNSIGISIKDCSPDKTYEIFANL